jgi:hypothetical protein
MTNSASRYSRPPPVTIWDLLQLMFVVSLFSAVIRQFLDQQSGAIVTFAAILAADLLCFAAMLVWFALSATAAQKRAGVSIASLAYTHEYRRMRQIAHFMTLAASLPYQALLIAFAANFRAMGPIVVGVALLAHGVLAVAMLHYWRLARRRGAELSEQGLLLHGSQFLAWRDLASYRYSDVRGRIVFYGRSQVRFSYHEFDLPAELATRVLDLVTIRLPRS